MISNRATIYIFSLSSALWILVVWFITNLPPRMGPTTSRSPPTLSTWFFCQETRDMLRKYRCQCNKCLSVSSSQNLKSGFTTWILLDNSLFTRVAKCDHKAPSCYPTGSRESQSCLPQKENWFIRNSRQKRQPNSDFVIMFMILGSSQASQIERLNGQTSAPLRRVIYTHQSYTTNSLWPFLIQRFSVWLL